MTFTELELLLGLAVGVLLWHVSTMNTLVKTLTREHDRLAKFLMKIGDGEGTVVVNNNEYIFKEINGETKSVSSI